MQSNAVPSTASVASNVSAAAQLVEQQRIQRRVVGAFVVVLGLTLIPFYDALALMVSWWDTREEYSYGYFILPLALYFLWERRAQLVVGQGGHAWAGLLLAIAGMGLFLIGSMSTLLNLMQYAWVLVIHGLMLSLFGWRGYQRAFWPLFLLLLMIPLPNFLYNNLSSQLQLWSSQLGVLFIRLFEIPVHLEGNVIDLGAIRLQVVEACSGLRYLFPLFTLAVVFAYLLRVATWVKVLVVVASAPVTVLMNSLRIGLIGVTSEYWGTALAEGFLHDFEGWVVFMLSGLVLMLLTRFAMSVSGDRRALLAVLGPAPAERVPLPTSTESLGWFWVTALAIGVFSFSALLMPERHEHMPDVPGLNRFPMVVGDDWLGSPQAMESKYVEVLKFDDYVMGDYRNHQGDLINLYVAFYRSQRSGASVHSPKSCLPGGGWRMESFGQTSVPGVIMYGQPLVVNRSIITQGNDRQLVYYWFQQRGRLMTNEYLVKWYLLVDALFSNRTDGALVRLIVPVSKNELLEAKERQLQGFLQTVSPVLQSFIPGDAELAR